ncbi:MAG: hypothetical protein IJA78_00790 [Clostridia bacterium]|nr:hypothetical protein [Clostridia bacterium]
MTIVKYIVVGILLFAAIFSFVFFLTDKTEHYTVDSYVQEPLVYITDHGECYHAWNCHYLERSKNANGLYDARSKGYRACSYCDGAPHGTIEVPYKKTEAQDVTCKVVIQAIIFASVGTLLYATGCVTIHFYRKSNTKKERQI